MPQRRTSWLRRKANGMRKALEHALRTNARYISFVASHAKARKIIGFLATKGVPSETLSRIKAPAGLQIGTSSSQEIAVSILAEIIQMKKDGTMRAARQREARLRP